MSDDIPQAWQNITAGWQEDWGGLVDHLVAETDLADRSEALLYLIARAGQAWSIGVNKQSKRQEKLFPRLESMMERIEEQLDQGEDWKD